MRVPVRGHASRRAAREGSNLNSTAVSVLINVLLVAVLLYGYYAGPSMPSPDSGVEGRPEVLLQSLKGEIRNMSASLESAMDALHEQEFKLVAEKAAGESSRAAFEQSFAALRAERDSLQEQLTVHTPPGSYRDAQNIIGAPQTGKPWLTIGIPTIPRKNQTDYLTRTLSSLMEEVPLDPTDPMHRQVRVIVMNNRPGAHPVWEQVRDRVHRQGAAEDEQDLFVKKGRLYLEFVDNPGTVADPTPNAVDPDDNNNPTNRPGREVRRQTCDLVSLLEMAQPLSHYYMFMEDDFRVCPYTLRALAYAVRKLNTVSAYGNWLALRFSYGMNGILVKTADLQTLTAYLRRHTHRLPPDLLWTEWYTGRRPELRAATRGRLLAIFRVNLLDHIGARSSFAVRAFRPEWPRCFHPMSDVWSLAKSEKFNERRCGHADLSPCPPGDGGELWTNYPLQWPNITEGSEADHPPIPPEELIPPPNKTQASRERQGSRIGALRKVANRRFGESDVSLSGATR